MTCSIQNTVFLIHCVSWAKLTGRVLFLQVLFECCYACKKRKSQKEQCWHQRLTTSSVQKLYSDTVDGSEIRRSPVEETVVYPMIYDGLYTPLVLGLGISEPPTVFYIGRSYKLYLIYVLVFCHTCFLPVRTVRNQKLQQNYHAFWARRGTPVFTHHSGIYPG